MEADPTLSGHLHGSAPLQYTPQTKPQSRTEPSFQRLRVVLAHLKQGVGRELLCKVGRSGKVQQRQCRQVCQLPGTCRSVACLAGPALRPNILLDKQYYLSGPNLAMAVCMVHHLS